MRFAGVIQELLSNAAINIMTRFISCCTIGQIVSFDLTRCHMNGWGTLLEKLGRTNNTRRVCMLLVILGAGVFSVAVGPDAVSALADCQLAQRWVAERLGNLPTDYDDFSALPVGYRKAVFRTLSADRKSGLWREHFQRFRHEHPSLTKNQISLLSRLSDMPLENEFETDSVHRTTTADIQKLESEARSLFSANVARELFDVLGTPEATYRTLASVRLGVVLKLRGVFNVSANAQCACSDAANGCGDGYACVTTASHCDSTNYGCGFLWLRTCNGLCWSQDDIVIQPDGGGGSN